MGEISEYLREKYFKSKASDNLEVMRKQRIKNSILTLCDEYLTEVGQVLTFQVEVADSSNASMAILEEPLVSRYTINQTSNTMFEASIREIEF